MRHLDARVAAVLGVPAHVAEPALAARIAALAGAPPPETEASIRLLSEVAMAVERVIAPGLEPETTLDQAAAAHFVCSTAAINVGEAVVRACYAEYGEGFSDQLLHAVYEHIAPGLAQAGLLRLVR